MGRKAAETMHINNTFGPGTANEHTVQWWFKKFCKGNESLEDEEHSGWLLEVNNQLRAIIEVDPLTTIQEVAEERHLKQIGKVKKLGKCVPQELTEKNKQTNIILKCCLLLLHTTTNHFLIKTMTCNEKRIVYNNQQQPARWLDQEAPKHFPKPNPHPKKVMVTVWWPAASLIYYSFLNLSKTITSEKYAQFTDEMHQKLKCLVLVNRKDPILHDNV